MQGHSPDMLMINSGALSLLELLSHVLSSQDGFASQLLGRHGLSTWITTPTPTASVPPLPLEGSAWLVSTVPQEAQSLFPALQGFTAMPQVSSCFRRTGGVCLGGVETKVNKIICYLGT